MGILWKISPFVMFIIIFSDSFAGSVYQCNRNGTVVWTDRPCRQDEKTVGELHASPLDQSISAYFARPSDHTRRDLIREARNTSCKNLADNTDNLFTILKDNLPADLEDHLNNCKESRRQRIIEKRKAEELDRKLTASKLKSEEEKKTRDEMRIFLENEYHERRGCWGMQDWGGCLQASRQRIIEYCNDMRMSDSEKITCLKSAEFPSRMDYRR